MLILIKVEILITFLGLTKAQRKMIQYEVITERARLQLTRLIRGITTCEDDEIEILRQNKFINIARSVIGSSIYVLEANHLDYYHPVEHAWHYGELELVMRRPNTEQLIETLADFIENNLVDHVEINEILQEDGSSVSFSRVGHNDKVRINIVPIDELEEIEEDDDQHPNIRVLVNRMDRAIADKDFAGVLHASASIFETLGKVIVNSPNVENQTLGSFFDKYRKMSVLPVAILDYILEIYKRRNVEPLAGHGNTQAPTISEDETIVLAEMTKAFVRIERQLAMPQINIDTGTTK